MCIVLPKMLHHHSLWCVPLMGAPPMGVSAMGVPPMGVPPIEVLPMGAPPIEVPPMGCNQHYCSKCIDPHTCGDTTAYKKHDTSTGVDMEFAIFVLCNVLYREGFFYNP